MTCPLISCTLVAFLLFSIHWLNPPSPSILTSDPHNQSSQSLNPSFIIILIPLSIHAITPPSSPGKAALVSPLLDGGSGWFAPLEALSLCLMGGTLATALIFSEITLLNTTSSLTFSVLGQVKEMIQIVLGNYLSNKP